MGSYLYKPTLEQFAIIGSPILITLAVLLLYRSDSIHDATFFPAWLWLLCVVGIDVAHVWSTLFRTYFDSGMRVKYRTAFTVVPLACWMCGVLVYSFSNVWFWSIFAYLAVFHFIRQQYGIFALYSRNIHYASSTTRYLDTTLIYLATIYPLLSWHTHAPKNFDWFVPGDFIFPVSSIVSSAAGYILTALLLCSVVLELRMPKSEFNVRLPKNLVLWGTTAAWYVGIVHFNADIPFTVTNVVSHGIPYLALIWIFAQKASLSRKECSHKRDLGDLVNRYIFQYRRTPQLVLGACSFLGAIFILAYCEEALWDVLVWRDHRQFFGWLWWIPAIRSDELLALLVPLLAVPQASHYILDGFIWRFRGASDARI